MMSEAWSGGKGDKSRVSDVQAYSKNFDRIFRKKDIKVGYNLFLDDFRNPKDAWLYGHDVWLLDVSDIPISEWVIVRSYQEFVDFVNENGIPNKVSFDNDLNSSHLKAFEKALSENYYDWERLSETGIHCALFLKNKCKETNVPFPKAWVHTANHFARTILNDIINGKD